MAAEPEIDDEQQREDDTLVEAFRECLNKQSRRLDPSQFGGVVPPRQFKLRPNLNKEWIELVKFRYKNKDA